MAMRPPGFRHAHEFAQRLIAHFAASGCCGSPTSKIDSVEADASRNGSLVMSQASATRPATPSSAALASRPFGMVTRQVLRPIDRCRSPCRWWFLRAADQGQPAATSRRRAPALLPASASAATRRSRTRFPPTRLDHNITAATTEKPARAAAPMLRNAGKGFGLGHAAPAMAISVAVDPTASSPTTNPGASTP